LIREFRLHGARQHRDQRTGLVFSVPFVRKSNGPLYSADALAERKRVREMLT